MSGHCEEIVLKLTKVRPLSQSGYGIEFQFEYDYLLVLGLNWVKETSCGHNNLVAVLGFLVALSFIFTI